MLYIKIHVAPYKRKNRETRKTAGHLLQNEQLGIPLKGVFRIDRPPLSLIRVLLVGRPQGT